jgi:hypothetical protein
MIKTKERKVSFKKPLVIIAIAFFSYHAYFIYCKVVGVSPLYGISCENMEVSQKESPSGKLRVVFYERTCDKLFSTANASIIPMSAVLQNEPGNTLVIVGFVPEAEWISDTEIRITYFGETKTLNSRVNNVNVVFKDNTRLRK